MASRTEGIERIERRLWGGMILLTGIVILLAITAFAGRSGDGESSRFDASLPNPMGGPARTAPGEITGHGQLAGLQIEGTEIAMGDVALNVTYVPSWDVVNPTDGPIVFQVGMPQVLDGCCPGPVYVNGELTQVGQSIEVAAGGQAEIQFPLQMHRGMDGVHHLVIPLTAEGETNGLHVTGNFDPSARA